MLEKADEQHDTEIISSVMGIGIIITQSSLAKLLGLENSGFLETDTNEISSKYREIIRKTFYKEK